MRGKKYGFGCRGNNPPAAGILVGSFDQIGSELGRKYGVKYLPSDFKKKDGYKRSIIMSKEYGLYRQDYCGCIYSIRNNIEE